MIEKDEPQRLRYLVKPKTLGMVRTETKTSSFVSPFRNQLNRIKPECDEILRINYHSQFEHPLKATGSRDLTNQGTALKEKLFV